MFTLAFVLIMVWSIWKIYATYKGAAATKGPVSWTLYLGVFLGVAMLLGGAVIMFLPDSVVSKWYIKGAQWYRDNRPDNEWGEV